MKRKKEAKQMAKQDEPKRDEGEPAGAADDKEDDKAPATAGDKEEPATPSLAQQSKLRSTSFRAGSGSGPVSPVPFSPDGDTAPDIYRKHVARIEELERDNKRLAKEAADSERRWKRAEEALSGGGSAADEKLVCTWQRWPRPPRWTS